MRLLVFLHGTVLMPAGGVGVTRAERVAQARAKHPNVLIEDDCESIGADQITYPQIAPSLRAPIKSIIIPEFSGIDHLPDDPQALLHWLSPPAPTSPETAQSAESPRHR